MRIKRVITSLLAVSMLFAECLTGYVTKEEKQVKAATTLLAHYDFETDGVTTVTDVTGNGYDASIHGTGAVIDNGEITLPGGTFGSGAAYMEMPKGMFDGKDTLTISVWLKNTTGNGNYAAMYIGTEADTSKYWLFNPRNPGGTFKTVVTENTYIGEYGFSPTNSSQGILGPVSSEDYALYTTVIEDGQISAYYNGESCGTVSTGISVSEMGENLVGYIGKSPYPDIFFSGSISDIKIYARVLEEREVKDAYYSGLNDGGKAARALIETDKDLLVLPSLEVLEDIELPAVGANATTITWHSSNEKYLTAEGKVTRPAEGSGDVTVTLTATISIGGESVKKEFQVVVLENTAANDFRKRLEKFDLPEKVVTEDISLPQETEDGLTFRWKSEDTNHITDNGKVTRPKSGEGNKKVVLTAEASYQGLTAEKQFTVEVVEEAYGKILTYVREGDWYRTDALHYAYSIDGKSYEALNNNRPILYRDERLDKMMGSPSLFRKADGSYGMITTDNNSNTNIVVYDSEDLLYFTNPRTVSVNDTGVIVSDPSCRYDSAYKAYRVNYKGSDGRYYDVLTEDFVTYTSPVISKNARIAVTGKLPEGAIETDVFEVTKSEYDAILRKWKRVVNTSVSALQDIHVESGKFIEQIQLPEKATANYSDGSTKKFPINWDKESINKIDTTKAGVYEVTGTINQPEYADILVEERADPWATLGDDGYYYFTGSYPVCGTAEENQGIGYDRVVLRRAKSLSGLTDAEEVTIWHTDDCPDTYRYIWAPEVHQINGRWYVFFTASLEAANPYNIRPHVLECVGKNPMDPDNWVIHRMEAMEGDSFAVQQFSLDMTCFESAGIYYVAWAANPGDFSNIYIGTINPDEPWKLTSKATKLTKPDFGWENPINEGPAVIKNNGKVYLCYSAAAVNYTYCVGMLSAKEGADLLDISSWTKYPIPLLSTDDLVNQCGPGHNSFTVDENGNPVIVYHARPIHECSSGGDWDGTVGRCEYINPGENSLIDPCRHARIKSVNFAADGTPILNMTPEEELKEEYKTITVKVIISDKNTSTENNAGTNTDGTDIGGTNTDSTNAGAANTDDNQALQIKRVELSKTTYVYNGKTRTPKVTVYNNKEQLVDASCYTIRYAAGRKKVGKYNVTVTFKNGYSGSVVKTFTICPKAPGRLKAGKIKSSAWKITWKKVKKEADGYQLQYSTNSKFKKGIKTKTLTGKNKTSITIRKVSSKKTYYVRVRTYKKVKVNGKSKKIYSAWSKKVKSK